MAEGLRSETVWVGRHGYAEIVTSANDPKQPLVRIRISTYIRGDAMKILTISLYVLLAGCGVLSPFRRLTKQQFAVAWTGGPTSGLGAAATP